MKAGRGRAPFVLAIAGSDPSGGAGLELQLKVLARHGIHGGAIASCATIQSARGLVGFAPESIGIAQRQLAQLLLDTPVAAVTIGMLPDARWVELAASALKRLGPIPSLYDPVFAPTRGRRVLPRAALRAVRERLLPRVELLTPNALEAAELLEVTLAEVERDPDAAARALLRLGPRWVLLKGGHLRERAATDRLRWIGGARDFASRREAGESPRGTGCALAAAITAWRALGASVPDAVASGRRWLARARRARIGIGGGRNYLGLV